MPSPGSTGDLAAHPKGKDGVTTLIVAMHIPPGTNRIRPPEPGTTTSSGARGSSRS